MKKTLSLFAGALFWIFPATAQIPEAQPLYPQGAPDNNGLPADKAVYAESHAEKIAEADYMLFRADPSKATGQAVVICPGGAYLGVAYTHEGIQVAQWMNERGITALMLRYRMPNGHHDIPQRPDFSILIYPVITMDERYTHKVSREELIGRDAPIELVDRYSNEKQVSDRTPVTFLALSDDDGGVPPVNSTMYYEALKAHGVPAELHVYPSGGHGWGWLETFKYHDELRTSLDRWLKEIRK